MTTPQNECGRYAETSTSIFLVFTHLGTRRRWISPSTVHPDNEWTCQQARNFLMHADDVIPPPQFVLRDNDVKYPKGFDEIFNANAAEVVRNPIPTLNLRAQVERFIQTHQVDFLNRFVVDSERHLNHINREFQHWYDHERPNSAREHLPGSVIRQAGEIWARSLLRVEWIASRHLDH